MFGSRATLTSKKSLSHRSTSEMAGDERSSERGEDVKDCNGRLIPRLMVRSATMVEVYVTVSANCQTLR